MLIDMLPSRGYLGSSSVMDSVDIAVIMSANTKQPYKNVLHFVPRSVKSQAPRGTVFTGMFLLVSACAMKTKLDIVKIQITFTSEFS